MVTLIWNPKWNEKWNISATRWIQAMKSSTLCCSRKSTLRTSKPSPSPQALKPASQQANVKPSSPQASRPTSMTARSIQWILVYTSLDYFFDRNTMRYFSRLDSNALGLKIRSWKIARCVALTKVRVYKQWCWRWCQCKLSQAKPIFYPSATPLLPISYPSSTPLLPISYPSPTPLKYPSHI